MNHVLPALALWVCALTACGGGGGGPVTGTVTVWGTDPQTTSYETETLAGTAFVPRGASCSYYPGPFAPPSCNCDVGSLASGQWTNTATGASGMLELHVVSRGTCYAADLWWRATDIGLQPGNNAITVTISDGTTSGSATATVLRN